MSSPITTILALRKRCGLALFALTIMLASTGAQAQELTVPSSLVAGSEARITAPGRGDATFYLIGPASSVKQNIHLGQDIRIKPEDVGTAGRYIAIVCQGTCHSADFYVVPGSVSYLSLLVHPSRAAVDQPDVLSGVALPFDGYRNLILNGIKVDFHLRVDGQDITSRSLPTQYGVAWFRASSGHRAGAVQVVASSGDVSARRVVQQVASDPCHLQVKADRDAKGVELETEPVRDCAGNPVPDGTIVTFRATGAEGVSTVDAPIKQGIARARILAEGPMVISVASGVVMGNEVRVEAHR